MNNQLKRYLKNNHNKITIGEDDGFSSLSIVDDDLEDKEIFLTGENHGVKANVKLRMKFLEYFKQKTDFKYYLCELPFSVAYFLNMYLKTGNEDLLKMVYRPLKGTDAWNKDDYEHWMEVYELNESMPKDRKITIVGVDIEHQPKNALIFMDYCLYEKDIPKEIEGVVDDLKIIIKTDRDLTNDELKRFSKKLDMDLDDKEEIYRILLKENYYKFKHINKNLLNMYEVYQGNNFNDIRDRKMYQNFIELYNRLPKGKYYGQLGLSHIFQRPFPYVNWFGAALNSKESIFRGKVLSIAYVYHNCKYLYPTIRKNYISSINTLDPALEVFNDFTKGEYTIFKLNGKDSPFIRKLIWPILHKLPEGGVTADYFQYLVIVKDSQAANPLELKEHNK